MFLMKTYDNDDNFRILTKNQPIPAGLGIYGSVTRAMINLYNGPLHVGN